MNVQDYIQRQKQRRNRVIVLCLFFMAILLALIFFSVWVLQGAVDPSIPAPGTVTAPPEGYPELEAHAVTMAGYDLTDENQPYILLSDPGDNAVEGLSHVFDSEAKKLPLVTDDRWWFIDYPGETIGCIFGALIVRESSRDLEDLPVRSKNADLPDLSQNAVEECGSGYCAPTALANIAWMLGEKYPQISPLQVFGFQTNAPRDLQANMLIAGTEKPFPNPASLAGLMDSKPNAGTELLNLGTGMKAFLGNALGEWKLNDPDYLEPDSFIQTLKEESAHGSGVVLFLHWGNLKMDEERNRGSILIVLERNMQQTASPEQQQAEFRNSVTNNEAQEENDDIELPDVIAVSEKNPVVNTNDLGPIKEDVMERLKDVKAGSGDIQLSLVWNNYNDLDLSCTEPDGTVIDFENRLSSSGGNLDVDMNATPQSKRPVENIYWPLGQARRGKYQVYANYYRRHTLSREKIEVTLRVLIGNKEQFLKAKLPPESGRVLIHSFEYQ